MESIDSLIDEYPPEYCRLIEAAYGENWMGDGGEICIDSLFSGVDLNGKRVLDIGSGLGGAVFYFARKYGAIATGLEINPWLVEEGARRCPETLKSQVDFRLYNDVANLPFADNEFDVVFSHGSLVHVAEKETLFKEAHRILKKGGQLMVYDWLAPPSGKWGDALQTMCDNENLTLIPTTELQYEHALASAKFVAITIECKNEIYAKANRAISKRLRSDQMKRYFAEHFGDQARVELAAGHDQIAQSIEAAELLTCHVFARNT